MSPNTFEHLKASYERKPVQSYFGMEVVSASAEAAVMRLPFSERVVNLAGTCEGGVLSILVDSSCSVAFEFGLDANDVAITVDLRIDYISPLTEGKTALATATVVNRGRTIGRCSCTITEEGSGKLLSTGTTVFVIRQRQRW